MPRLRHRLGLPVQGFGRARGIGAGRERPSDRRSPHLAQALRQAGILAAAGRYALAHHIERLADDHARAARLGQALGAEGTQTNIVVVPVVGAAQAAEKAAEQGVLCSAIASNLLRLVTHLDIDDDDVDRAIDVLGPLVGR